MSERVWRPLRILAADDDVGVRRFFTAVIEGSGHRATVAESGAQALAAFAREPFDLVLLDLRMPGLDGFATAAALRDHEARAGGDRVPLLAMSGDMDEATLVHCLKAGMDGHIAKPVSYRELVDRIERMAAAPAALLHAAASGRPSPGALHSQLAGLAARFLADALRLVGEIEVALARLDAPALRTAAHQLYGSAGLFQAEHARILARRIEERAEAGDFSEASHALARELAAELEALGRALPLSGLAP